MTTPTPVDTPVSRQFLLILAALQEEVNQVFPFFSSKPYLPYNEGWKINSQSSILTAIAHLGATHPNHKTSPIGSLVISISKNTGAVVGYISTSPLPLELPAPIKDSPTQKPPDQSHTNQCLCHGREAFDGNQLINITGFVAHAWTVWTQKVAPRCTYVLTTPPPSVYLDMRPGDKIEVSLDRPYGNPTPWFRFLPPHSEAGPSWISEPYLPTLISNGFLRSEITFLKGDADLTPTPKKNPPGKYLTEFNEILRLIGPM